LAHKAGDDASVAFAHVRAISADLGCACRHNIRPSIGGVSCEYNCQCENRGQGAASHGDNIFRRLIGTSLLPAPGGQVIQCRWSALRSATFSLL
jgi:hypothetical protein